MLEGSWVQQTSYGIVTFIFRQLVGEWSNQAWLWFSQFFGPPVAVLDNPLVQQLVRLTVAIALGFLPVAIGWRVLKETLARMDGTSAYPPEALVRQALTAGTAVTATSLIAWFMVTLANHARSALAGVGLNIDLLRQFFDSPVEPISTVLLLSLVFVFGAVMLTIQRAVMSAELTILLAVGPLLALTLVREDNKNSWNTWILEIAAILVTPLIQMLILQVFLHNWADASGLLSIGDRLASLALLYLLYTTPRWARQMIYSVNVGAAVADASVGAYRLVMIRQILKAAVKM